MPARIATSHLSVAAASDATASRPQPTHPQQRPRQPQPVAALDDPRIKRENAELRRRLRDAKPRALALANAAAANATASAVKRPPATERTRAAPSLRDSKIRRANAALRHRIRNTTSKLAGLFRRSDASTKSSATTAASTASIEPEIGVASLERMHRERDALATHDSHAVQIVAPVAINTDIDVDIELDWDAVDALVDDIAASSAVRASLPALSAGVFALPLALKQPPSQPQPLQLEDIRYGHILGKGAFATVVLATVARDQHAQHAEDAPLFALKVLDKDIICEKQAQDNVLAEKHALRSIPRHPAVLQLHATFHDHHNLYLLTDLVSGGELYELMRQVSPHGLPIHAARFYTANTILGLQHIHAHDFVFRDLKAENLVLGDDGYLTFVDFGFAKHLPPVPTANGPQQMRAFTVCGTPEYMAPEIFTRRGYDRAADWWALGVLAYEMLVGRTPFVENGDDRHYNKLLANIACKGATNHRIRFPQRIRDEEPDACDLIERLLQADPQRRLGMQSQGELRQHAWFQRLDWDALLHKRLAPPHVPTPLQRRPSLNSDQDSDFDADEVRVSQFKRIEHAPLDSNDLVDTFFADF